MSKYVEPTSYFPKSVNDKYFGNKNTSKSTSKSTTKKTTKKK